MQSFRVWAKMNFWGWGQKWGYPPRFLGVRFGYLDPIFIWTSYTRFAQKHLFTKLKIRGRPQKCKVFEYGPRRIFGFGVKNGGNPASLGGQVMAIDQIEM